MRKIQFVLLTTLLALNISAQKYLKITNAYSSIQIKVSADQVSKLHYVVYKTLPTTDPSALDLKTLANNASITNIERKGVVSITDKLLGDTLTQSLINIPAVTNNTPKLLYIYAVYEDGSNVLGNVVKQTLTFVRKQPAYTFQSTTLNTTLTTVNYVLYLPESYYHDDRNKKYPLIVFFHGDGQKGDNVDQVRTDALPNYLDGTLNLDFIVVSPQQNGWKQTWTKPSFVEELVALTKKDYRVDATKIYGVGCSGGGGGLYNFGSKYPGALAAMSPMSGAYSLSLSEEYCPLKDIPFWGFHSDGDNTINLNNLTVAMNNINECGPIMPLKKTVYKGNIHDCWRFPLKQDSLYRFFLARDLKNKTNRVEPIAFDTNLTVFRNSSGLAEINFPSLVDNDAYEYFWYQKSGNDVIIKDQHSRVPSLLNPNLGGTYKFRLLLKKPNGNTNYRDVVVTVSTVTSIEDVKLDKSYNEWQIFDLTGRKVRENTKSKPDLEGLERGVYVVSTNEGSFKVYAK